MSLYASTRDRKSPLLEHRGIPLIHEIASHGVYPLHDHELIYPKKKLLGH